MLKKAFHADLVFVLVFDNLVNNAVDMDGTL